MQVFCAYDEIVDIEKVIPNPKNPNKHPDKQIELLAKIIQAQGWRAPITVSNRSGFVIRGHGRLMAARKLNLGKVPIDYQDYESEAQEWADMIADNKLAELSFMDEVTLAEILASLESDFDKSLSGFSMDEITELLGPVKINEAQEDEFDIETAYEDANKNTITKEGDMWLLGKHKLICGSCTDIAVVERLTGGNLVDMVFTDPPYNVNYQSADGKKIKNDNMPQDEFNKFLQTAFANMCAITKPGGAIYVCHADSAGIDFKCAMTAAGWLVKQCLIWAKNNFVLGRQDYQWKHEPILYGWKEGAAHKWYGKRKQSTVIENNSQIAIQKLDDGFLLTLNADTCPIAIKVPSYQVVATDENSSIWHIDKPIKSAEHPTMKPIKLCARAICNSSSNNGSVADLFGGSGSTLIACEQTGRTCYTLELDPVYADVIVKRWEMLTGKKAVRA